jgi:hypothetical protein
VPQILGEQNYKEKKTSGSEKRNGKRVNSYIQKQKFGLHMKYCMGLNKMGNNKNDIEGA